MSDEFTNDRLASSRDQLEAIARSLQSYGYLPFASDSVPGAYVEAVIANERGGQVLRTYDFVDVADYEGGIGWQVKSTKEATPVTWKRAKIPGAPELIAASEDPDESTRDEAIQALGDAIIEFCNRHAADSLEKYRLEAIAFARVVVTPSLLIYYERELLTAERPQIFDPLDFRWRWSVQKETGKKEQLSALHGQREGEKWFAWHGRGENQLHFSGERFWWPDRDSPHRVAVPLPNVDDRMDFVEFVELVTEGVEKLRAPA